MKKFTSTSKKVIALGASSLLLTGALVAGCIANNNDGSPAATPQPTVTSTDTSTPSPVTPEPSAMTDLNMTQFESLSPELQGRYRQAAGDELSAEILAASNASPMGIDMEKVFAEATAEDVLLTFSEDKGYKAKEGVTSALQAYEELLSIDAWSHARTGADDANLIVPLATSEDGEAVFDAELMKQLKANIADKGQLTFVPTIAADGTTKVNGVVYKTDGKSRMVTASGQPTVKLITSGDKIHVEGRRSFSLKLADGKTLVGERLYFFDVTPSKDGPWLLSNAGEKLISVGIRDTAEFEAEVALSIAKALSAQEGSNG